MNDAKYIGMDVHQATISVAVRDSRGNLVMEAILETKADTILEFIHGLRGSLSVTFEEGTWAAWLHDLLLPHVTRVVACDPRKNALLKVGNHNDRMDARKLSELLYLNKLSPVYHGEQGIRTNTPEPINLTWAGKRTKHPCSFQSPEIFSSLTFPFIERAYRNCPQNLSRLPLNRRVRPRTTSGCANRLAHPLPSGGNETSWLS
jgi:hypothetical protein